MLFLSDVFSFSVESLVHRISRCGGLCQSSLDAVLGFAQWLDLHAPEEGRLT